MQLKKVYLLLLIPVLALLISAAPSKENVSGKEQLITIETKFGEIKMILFDDTPVHKKNFIELAEAGRYDGSVFHRVIENFMIQGGGMEPLDKAAWDTLSFEDKTLPNEIMDKYKHHRGAVAAARIDNLEKRSDKNQFYIVQNFTGSHHLDMHYTVFGQVLAGMDVVDKIARVEMDSGNKPVEDIAMKIRVEKVNKKHILKFYGDVYKRYNIGIRQ